MCEHSSIGEGATETYIQQTLYNRPRNGGLRRRELNSYVARGLDHADYTFRVLPEDNILARHGNTPLLFLNLGLFRLNSRLQRVDVVFGISRVFIEPESGQSFLNVRLETGKSFPPQILLAGLFFLLGLRLLGPRLVATFSILTCVVLLRRLCVGRGLRVRFLSTLAVLDFPGWSRLLLRYTTSALLTRRYRIGMIPTSCSSFGTPPQHRDSNPIFSFWGELR